MTILTLDPSGSFKYGSGTTGYCLAESETKEILKVGNIKANRFKTREEYFNSHKNLIKGEEFDVLVIENFILYKDTAATMYNQELETSELIGFICGIAEEEGKKIIRQRAQAIKTVLKKEKIVLAMVNQNKKQLEFKTTREDKIQWFFKEKRISNHIVDAIKHTFYYINEIKKGERK